MATIAVGDIHGHHGPLLDLLAQLTDQVDTGDTVVFLGDYIDRGPHTKDCVDAILEFTSETRADVVCLCGNHEDWMLQSLHDHTRHSWLLGMDPFETIESYSREAARALRRAAKAAGAELYQGPCALPYNLFFDELPEAHLRFFESLLAYHEGPDCICVHGGLHPKVTPIGKQSRRALIWGGNGFPKKYRGPEIVLYGHENNAIVDERGWPHPRIDGCTIGLDTISHGVLTAMRMPDRAVLQSARYEAARPVEP